jgi:hypothetical protein
LTVRWAVLIEVKAIGMDLKEQYVKAADYAANQGCEWVTLTNGIVWKVYKVCFSKPIEPEFVVELDLLAVNPRSSNHIDLVGLLAKESWEKAHLGEYHTQRRGLEPHARSLNPQRPGCGNPPERGTPVIA